MIASMQTTLPRLLAPINELIAPAIRLGVANPLPLTSGLVLLEVVGRRSGILRSVPLVATDYGSCLVVTTVRADSHWLNNLAAADHATVWLRGKRRQVSASVYRRGEHLGGSESASAWAAPLSRLGLGVAVLT